MATSTNSLTFQLIIVLACFTFLFMIISYNEISKSVKNENLFILQQNRSFRINGWQ